MKNIENHTTARALLLVISFSFLSLFTNSAIAGEIKKYHDFAEAQKAAEEANLPIFIDFYTDWCKYCKQMDTITFIDPSVVSWLGENAIFAKIDSEDEDDNRTEFAEGYGVRGYPTFVLVNPDGSEIDRAVGFYDSEKFITTFTEFKEDKNTLSDYLRRLEKAPSAKLHYDFGEKYRWRAESEKADAHFASAIELDKDNADGIQADCRWSLADRARRDKDYVLAIERYKEMINKHPEHDNAETAYIYIALCLRDKGELQNAIAQFEMFKEKFPESEDVEYADKKIKQINSDIKSDMEESKAQ